MDPLTIGDARWEFLKQITFKSGEIVVCDPQVKTDGFVYRNLQTKTWDAWVLKQHEDVWGWRNARLVLTLPGERPIYEYKEGKKTHTINVDSGQAGFFDCYELEEAVIGDEIAKIPGICVTSGLGDGCYELWSTFFPPFTIQTRQFTLVFLEEAPIKL